VKRLPVVLSLAIAAVLASVSISYSSEYEIIQITSNEYNDESPQINSEGDLVWSAYVTYADDKVESEIFFYDGSPLPILLTEEICVPRCLNHAFPQINAAGDVVWRTSYPLSTGGSFGWVSSKRSDGNVARLEDSNNGLSPQINANGDVVWYIEYGDNVRYSEIFFHDGSSTTQLTNNGLKDVSPQINDNGYVVWYGRDRADGQTDDEIFLHVGSTTTQLTNNVYPDNSPQINDVNNVVWQGEYNLVDGVAVEDSDFEIFLNYYDDSIGERRTIQLTDNAFDDDTPQINAAGEVVWRGRYNLADGVAVEDSDFEIFLNYYDDTVGERRTIQLTNNDYPDNSPQINAVNSVVWQGKYNLVDGIAVEDSDFEIFLNYYDDSIGERRTIQLTDNSFDDDASQINAAGEIVWRGKYNLVDGVAVEDSDYEIFLTKRMNRSSTADAGSGLAIFSEDQSSTVIQGTAIDPDDDSLTYRWLEAEAVLSEWWDVGPNGEANLDLSTIPNLPIGEHVLTLEVNDGRAVSSDQMVLAVNPNPISFFSLFGINSVWIFHCAEIHSGDIGVLDASLYPWFTRRAEVMIGRKVKFEEGVSAYGDSVKIRCGASVYDVHRNELRSHGTIRGNEHTPLTLPLDVNLPEFPEPQPGTHDYLIRRGERFTLDPGSYGDIKVRSRASLILTGGTYHLESLELGHYKAEVLFQGPTELIINNNLRSGVKAFIGPEDSAGFGAEAIRIYVNGMNGKTRKFCTFPKAVRIGPKNMVRANIYAPNGTIRIKRGSNAEGAFIGKDVRIGARVHVTHNSAF
jgi:hypothetical protein